MLLLAPVLPSAAAAGRLLSAEEGLLLLVAPVLPSACVRGPNPNVPTNCSKEAMKATASGLTLTVKGKRANAGFLRAKATLASRMRTVA